MNGKSYEVDAPSIDAFTQAYHGNGGGEGDFLHPVKPAPGSGWRGVGRRLLQYPGIVAGGIVDAGKTLGKVAHGEIDAASPEAIGASATIGSTFGPGSVAAGTGRQIARMADPGYTTTPKITPNIQAAQTAADVGSPLPAGIVSPTPGVQALTQGFRQVPFVGPSITHSVQNTINATGRRVGEIAEDLSGGAVPDRGTVGAQTKQSLQNVIADNKSKIDFAYDDLRNNHINPDAMASVPRTEAALRGILRERRVAGNNSNSDLKDVINLSDQGTTFNGLQRARSDIINQIEADDINPHPGFQGGDLKRIKAAMTADLEGIARYHAKSTPDQAVESFRNANDTAAMLIERNNAIAKLIGNTSDEGLTGKLINASRDKGGHAQLLAELRSQMPRDEFEKISGIAIHELGNTPDGFSLSRFATGWGKMSSSAKSVLVADPAHRAALDDISRLGSFLKGADKYRNTSNTAHAVGIGGILAHLAEAGVNPESLSHLGGALAGGYAISRVLGRPVSASSLRRWLETARNSARVGPARVGSTNTALSIATRNLLNNLPASANADQSEPPKREPLRVTVHPKSQDRPSSSAQPR
jgi:hypothetical protein